METYLLKEEGMKHCFYNKEAGKSKTEMGNEWLLVYMTGAGYNIVRKRECDFLSVCNKDKRQ